MFSNKFETCPGIVYGAGVNFGIKFSNSLRLAGLFNTVSNVFENYFIDVDTNEDISNQSRSNFFTIITGGIKGKVYVDDISVKAILQPEQPHILKINSSDSIFVEINYGQGNFISMLLDSAHPS